MPRPRRRSSIAYATCCWLASGVSLPLLGLRGKGCDILLDSLDVLARAEPPEDGQRRLEALPCQPQLPLLRVQPAVHMEEARLAIGIGQRRGQGQPIIERGRRLV